MYGICRLISLVCIAFLLYPAGGANAASQEGFQGKASWYGMSAHGQVTASGRVFDRHEYSAAHKTLPFGTVLRVFNTANGFHVLAVVTDRGPFTRGRVVDLSRRAAVRLNFIKRGVANVWCEVVSDENGMPLNPSEQYFVQFAVRPDAATAREYQRDLFVRLGINATVLRAGVAPFLYHVCTGPWPSFAEAEDALTALPAFYADAEIILGPAQGGKLPDRTVPERVLTKMDSGTVLKKTAGSRSGATTVNRKGTRASSAKKKP